MTRRLDDIYLAEYSVTQGAFHIETAREAVESNLRQIVGGRTNRFLPFAVCASHAEAKRACDALAEAMERHGGRPRALGVEEAAYRRGVLETFDVLANYLNNAELRQIHTFALERQSALSDFEPGKVLLAWVNDPEPETMGGFTNG